MFYSPIALLLYGSMALLHRPVPLFHRSASFHCSKAFFHNPHTRNLRTVQSWIPSRTSILKANPTILLFLARTRNPTLRQLLYRVHILPTPKLLYAILHVVLQILRDSTALLHEEIFAFVFCHWCKELLAYWSYLLTAFVCFGLYAEPV